MSRLAWGPLTIRVRLGAALVIALMPVLILGAAQSVVAFRRDAEERRTSLIAAAERSAAVTRVRIQAAEVLLETLDPAAIGAECSPRLGEAMRRSTGFSNLIRIDAKGQVTCAAGAVGADPGRVRSEWFQDLKGGKEVAVARVGAGAYTPVPAALIAVRAAAPNGAFEGALVALTPLTELNPELSDRTLPSETEVALADGAGRYLVWTNRA